MSLSSLRKLSLRSQLPILAGVVLAIGLFAIVTGTQQRQDTRSRAAGTGGTGNCSTINPSSTDTLISDNCTIQSGFNGSIQGSNNTIMGGLGGNITGHGNLIQGGSNGSISGNGNEVCGGLNGGITGNNNIIHGPVGGPINGTGNQINFSGPCGVIRQPSQPPTQPPTATPTTRPNGTCADGIDNNQNELIDAADPVCHTDGNRQNPASYDPSRNEGAIQPSVTTPPARCADNVDNDNNGFKDAQDSTCHTDNNPQNPNSYDPTRPGEQGGFNTCADSRDNNNNGLIDGGDPVCHTDGNPSNQSSYDPNRAETAVSPSVTVTPPIVTVTVPPGNTALKLDLLLHGLGKGGDSVNPNGGGNPNPRRPQRTVTVEVFNDQNQLMSTKNTTVQFNSTDGNFLGIVDMGTLASGVYTVKVKTPQFLKALIPGIQTITQGTQNQMPRTVMINGDIDGNNQVDIRDYNIFLGCYPRQDQPLACQQGNEVLSDLNDDGIVSAIDYNLFLRELSNRAGV